MKNTKENKLRYVSSHLYCDMWVTRYTPRLFKVYEMIPEILDDIEDYEGENLNSYTLELTSLADITDEHAEECIGKILCAVKISERFGDSPKEVFLHGGGGDYLNISSIDYLRSKGYALPFDGSSIRELKEYGWLKIKTI